jgi:hypothetical protein
MRCSTLMRTPSPMFHALVWNIRGRNANLALAFPRCEKTKKTTRGGSHRCPTFLRAPGVERCWHEPPWMVSTCSWTVEPLCVPAMDCRCPSHCCHCFASLNLLLSARLRFAPFMKHAMADFLLLLSGDVCVNSIVSALCSSHALSPLSCIKRLPRSN